MKVKNSKQTGKVKYQEFYPRKSKQILDIIDSQLGDFYGFTANEKEYIQHFDTKFRMGIEEAPE